MAFGNSHTPNDLRYSFSGADCRAFAFYPDQHKLKAYLDGKIKKFERYIAYIKEDPGWQKAEKEEQDLNSKKAKVQKIQKTTNQMIKEDQAGMAAGTGAVHNEAAYEQNEKERVAAQEEVDKQYKAMEKRGEHHKLANTRLEIKRTEQGRDKLRVLSAKFSGGDYAELESLATVSISIHEPKGMVRRLGHRNIVGYSRSTRTIAGTMIFTVIDNHPLAKLMALDPQSILETGGISDTKLKWMVDEMKGIGTSPDLAPDGKGESRTWVRTATDLAPFHLILNYMSEYQGGRILSSNATVGAARSQKLAEIKERQTKLKQMMAKANQELKDLDSKLKPKAKQVGDDEDHIHHSSGHESWTKEQKTASVEAQQRQKAMQEEHSFLEKTRQGILAKQKFDSADKSNRDADLKVSLMLEHVEFISQGTVTSVHDMVSEISIQFIASNIWEMASSGTNGLSEFDEISDILQQFAYAAMGGEYTGEVKDGIGDGYGHADLGVNFKHASGQNIRGKTGVQLIQPPDIKPANNKLEPYLPMPEYTDGHRDRKNFPLDRDNYGRIPGDTHFGHDHK